MKGSMKHIYIPLLLFSISYLRGCLCGTTLTKDSCGFTGESVSLSCTLPSAEFTKQIAWSNDIIGGDITFCTPGGCVSHSYSRYSTSADANGVYLTISSLNRTADDTTWKCTLQGETSSTINLDVRDYPTTCVLTKNSDGSFKCETDCGNPASDLTIDWFINTTSAVVDLSNPTVDRITTGCTTGGKAFATLPASSVTHDGHLYCKCGMQTACPQKALIVSGSEAVTGTPTPSNTTHATPKPLCSCSWLPCGWKCHYLYIIIAALVVIIVVVVVGVCCCYRRGYFGKNKEEDRKKSYTNKPFDKNETENGQPTDSHRHTAL